MAAKLGLSARLNYAVGGQGVGAWTEAANVRDLTLNLEKGESDVTTRANQGWKALLATLKEASVQFEMVWDTADAAFAAIRDAYLNDAVIGLQILDEDGGQGLQADFMVTSFSRSEPLQDGIKVSVTVKIAYSSTAPSWIGA